MTALATHSQPERAVARREPSTIKDLLEAAKPKIMAVVPKHLDPERLIRIALVTINRTPKLAECTPLSLLNAFMQAAQLGLDCGGHLGQSYLVPYGREATLIVGYRGMIDLARRGGKVKAIRSRVVRLGDEFEYEDGLEMKLRHRPLAPSSAPITHIWAVADFVDGGAQPEVMTIQEVEEIRKRSRASNAGPWVTDFAEMAKKTVVRRLCKYLPLSPDMVEAIDQSDRTEFGDIAEEVATVQPPPPEPKARTRKLAEKVAGKAESDSLPPPTDDTTQPEIVQEQAPAEGDPSAHEQVVIYLAETCDCSPETAANRLDAFTRKIHKKPFAEMSEGSLDSIRKHIADGTIKVEQEQ